MCPVLVTEEGCHFCRDWYFKPSAREETPQLEDLDEKSEPSEPEKARSIH